MTPTLSDYEDHMLARGLSATTTIHRLKFARQWWAQWQRWDVAGENVARWLDAYQGWTRYTYHNHLQCLFGWLVERGHVQVDPMTKIRQTPRPRPRPTPLSEVDLTRALTSATPRVRSYLMLGYLAGLRAFEIAKIHGGDVDPLSVHVVGKGGQSWTLPTHPALWELAQTYPRDGYWFPSPLAHREHVGAGAVSNSVAALFRSLGLHGATHRARHTYGTRMLRNGTNVRVIQTLLRHSSLTTTEWYLGVDEDERRAAVLGLVA